jgi:hypothetical protein
MKIFRDQLLELLLANVGEFVDLTTLIDKHCGVGNTFDNDDDTKIKCRLNVNLHLRELRDLGWINLNPQNGLSTSHSMNHEVGKRQFTLDYPVKARMTTKGEFEYKRTKRESETSNIQNIGVNYGIAAQVSQLMTTPQIIKTTEESHKGTLTSIGKWMLNNIVAVIIAGLILAFIIYKLGWNK